ncbi:unnamed protein product [Brachionus calyciflorus]|uniref:Retrotransposon gag domain-containing protein n=1 Tax=Brachionus calyciflorus TaxID=104777 RepID=A0A813W216_9BILA|nr:unnamed protein product [Brachionus calyciflorus]
MYNALLENQKKVVNEKIVLETDLSLKEGEIQIIKEKCEKVPNKFELQDIIEDWQYTANRIFEASGITNNQNKIFQEELVSAMNRKYRPLDHEQNIWEQLRSNKQTKGYIDDFRILMNRVNCMEEEDKIAYFIHGLQEDTKRHNQLKNPKSLEETILIVENFELFKRKEDKRSNFKE